MPKARHRAGGDASNKVEQRQLETGDTYGDKWLVLSGLKAGDKLIVEGTDKVAAGQEVKAEMKATEATPDVLPFLRASPGLPG
jgi:multidrug efflux pump subunit AcrA (membrane-fusion protein)